MTRVPLDIPTEMKPKYLDNFRKATKTELGRLMLFAGDQKIEHLNGDFYGENISSEDQDPAHLFEIASQATIGCFATQLGLIARYGDDYRSVDYLVKLNSKTNLVKTKQSDPISHTLTTVADVIEFEKNSQLSIVGVGYTIYLGSEYEGQMLKEAAQIISGAHRAGLLVVLWIYPRGQAVIDEKDPHLIAGACGVGASLGADFVKVNYPKLEGAKSEEIFREAVKAAGRTRVICAGGSQMKPEDFLEQLWKQIHISGASGNATGRNLHQRDLAVALRFANAISAITMQDASIEEAIAIYHGYKSFKL